MLDMAILGLLEEGDLHGYEIRRQLRDHLGILANVSFGSIYPALTRLEKSGAVAAAEGPALSEPSPAPSPPPTGSLSGELAVLRARRHPASRARKGKKVYRITGKGRALFAELLAENGPADDARSFGLRLAFARHLAPHARLALLERRRALLVQRLAEADTPDPKLDIYARSVVQHTADSLSQDVSWLDQLIASERSTHSAIAELTYEGDPR
ncbi:MAG TPA: PadR family transcriptional regulator [Acidimicrobiales bacterium]|jgi:DNA-binding PadR family transcriptional regulator